MIDNNLDYRYFMIDSFFFDFYEDVFCILLKVWRYFKYMYYMFDI